jgi:hypothetical protein
MLASDCDYSVTFPYLMFVVYLCFSFVAIGAIRGYNGGRSWKGLLRICWKVKGVQLAILLSGKQSIVERNRFLGGGGGRDGRGREVARRGANKALRAL